MNNNRGSNRRRGRGNNRQQGGGQQLNRIDSRARGNAPQLLEKYRKLAHDAHLNGDRVTEEYYLQFADHYFRVIADTRQRQEEQRARREERWQEGDSYREEGEEAAEFGNEGEYSPYDQPNYGNGNSNRREREERPRADERPRGDEREERGEQEGRNEEAGEQQAEQRSPYEPPENPFVRENRSARNPKGRRDDRRPRREEGAPDESGAAAGLDPDTLPPAISAVREEAPAAPADEGEAKPRRRTRRKPSADDAGEALESVG